MSLKKHFTEWIDCVGVSFIPQCLIKTNVANHHHVQVFHCGIDQVCFPGLHQLRQLANEPYDSS